MSADCFYAKGNKETSEILTLFHLNLRKRQEHGFDIVLSFFFYYVAVTRLF